MMPTTTTSAGGSGLRSRLRRLAELHPRRYVALHALAGLVAAMALIWIFASIAEDLTENGAMIRLDHAVADFAQGHSTEWGESFFVAVSWIGSQGLVVVMVVAAAWLAKRREWAELWALLGASAGGALLNFLLKMVFHRDRPEFASEFIKRSTYSFPSGHAMESITGFGMLAYLLHRRARTHMQRRMLSVGAVLLVLVIGFARVYLGVHYLSDVVAGYAAGAVWLLTCIFAYRETPAARHSRAAVATD